MTYHECPTPGSWRERQVTRRQTPSAHPLARRVDLTLRSERGCPDRTRRRMPMPLAQAGWLEL